MKKFLFFIITLLLLLSSCSDFIGENEIIDAKELVNSLECFSNDYLESIKEFDTYIFPCTYNGKSCDIYVFKNIDYECNYYIGETSIKYTYNTLDKKLFENTTFVKNIEYMNLDDFAKDIFAKNEIQCYTINDYWKFVRNTINGGKDFKKSTWRGKGYYYSYYISTDYLINSNDFDYIKDLFKKDELCYDDTLKISILLNIEEKKIYPEFILYKNDKSILELY